MKLVLAFLVLIAGCQKSSKALDENTLLVIVATAPENLDPRYASSQVAQTMSRLLYAPLLVISDSLMPEPFLAEKLVQTDPRTYRVYLKPQTVEAQDVVYTFENPGQAEIKAPIESIKALTKNLVEFKLKRPYAPFLTDLAGLGIVLKSGRESGPYRLKSHDSATETWLFEASPGWFEGRPKIKQIEFRVVRDPNSRLLELMKGKADLASGIIKPFQLPALKKYEPQVKVIETPGLDYAYLAMNLRKSPLSDVKVRQAISMALDLDSVLKAKFKGFATRATGMLPEGHWAKVAGLPMIQHDPVKAKKILEQAGYELPMKLTLLTGTDRFRQSIALIYQQQLKKIGIEVEIRVQEWATLFQNMKEGRFELYSAIWTPVVEPNLFDWVFHSDRIPGVDTAGGNRGGYRDTVIDRWIEQAQVTFDTQTRRELYGKIERRLLETLPYVPLWFENNITVMSSRLKDFKPTRTCSLLPLAHAYLEKR